MLLSHETWLLAYERTGVTQRPRLPNRSRRRRILMGDPLEEDLTQTALAKTYGSWHTVKDPAAARGYAR